MTRKGLIPPQIHTFCMETEKTDVDYVASRLYYAAVASGNETADVSSVDRTKYEKMAKALIPTLSIRRVNPVAEGQICKTLGSTPPVPNHKPFEPAQYKDIPVMENPQEKAEAEAAKQVPPVKAKAAVAESTKKEEVQPAPPATDHKKEASHLD